MEEAKAIKRALVSVYNKAGIEPLVRALDAVGAEIVSTGSTAGVIESFGAKVTRVEELTGFPECLDGRVKTLHPKVHAGILADLRLESHQKQLEELNVKPFDLVVVNLYPFQETVNSGASVDDCIEKIDIGGPSMVRAAAKNFANVAIVVEGDDYEYAAEKVKNGGFTLRERQDLSRKAFQHTASYDTAVANWFNKLDLDYVAEKVAEKGKNAEGGDGVVMPKWYGRTWKKKAGLRYGENSHQNAAMYSDEQDSGFSHLIANAKQHNGKEMSYNNYVDADAALRSAYDFEQPACAIIKHSNPCGIAVGETIEEAHLKAFACDPVSAYGGVVATNRPVTLEMANNLRPVFTEVVIAPGYEPEALELLCSKKKNLRILELSTDSEVNSVSEPKEYRLVTGGLLLQDRDVFQSDGDKFENWKLVAGDTPDEDTIRDLKFAWKACRSVKSNAILLAKDGASVGIGMGQVNRIDSCDLAVVRANTLGAAVQGSQEDAELSEAPERARGSVAASDAFFPFADGLQKLIDAGVKAVVQPGASIRDEEVIEAAKEAGIVMYLTGTRHFYH
ncbi:MAG: bifunctional phosphoribosylaminoimidazolecarboxamide formyltransferase/IMP cyclohydrolase [Candidatus Ancillula sp.]|jgi:phosphoribosylaminoimidazolecarboxamide formyltransferase/IMP cyclohydrolase|nr:bifunctional phosphoribosylaminoimidazolecarboxamide formyltransferase/IMP cyclohydrolase [Candidatus Ancillula sp.]